MSFEVLTTLTVSIEVFCVVTGTFRRNMLLPSLGLKCEGWSNRQVSKELGCVGYHEIPSPCREWSSVHQDGNFIHEEITSRLNSDNSYCHSVQNLLPSRLLSEDVKIKIRYKRYGLEPFLRSRQSLSY
jgi:hypothetical protein